MVIHPPPIGYTLYDNLGFDERETFMHFYANVHNVLVSRKYLPIEPICGYQPTSIYGTQPDWVYVRDDLRSKRVFRLSILGDMLKTLTDHAGMLLVIE